MKWSLSTETMFQWSFYLSARAGGSLALLPTEVWWKFWWHLWFYLALIGDFNNEMISICKTMFYRRIYGALWNLTAENLVDRRRLVFFCLCHFSKRHDKMLNGSVWSKMKSMTKTNGKMFWWKTDYKFFRICCVMRVYCNKIIVTLQNAFYKNILWNCG